MIELNPKKCSECENFYPTNQQDGKLIDYGWTFNHLALGYYGGFTDSVPDDLYDWDDDKYNVYLCHDCCIKIIQALPKTFEKALGAMGCHPGNVGEPSCCKYSWTTDTSGFSYRGDGEGGWVLYRLD